MSTSLTNNCLKCGLAEGFEPFASPKATKHSQELTQNHAKSSPKSSQAQSGIDPKPSQKATKHSQELTQNKPSTSIRPQGTQR